jgi:hypothetical protein
MVSTAIIKYSAVFLLQLSKPNIFFMLCLSKSFRPLMHSYFVRIITSWPNISKKQIVFVENENNGSNSFGPFQTYWRNIMIGKFKKICKIFTEDICLRFNFCLFSTVYVLQYCWNIGGFEQIPYDFERHNSEYNWYTHALL